MERSRSAILTLGHGAGRHVFGSVVRRTFESLLKHIPHGVRVCVFNYGTIFETESAEAEAFARDEFTTKYRATAADSATITALAR